ITSSTDTKVLGNYIGTDVSGSAAVANIGFGVSVNVGLRTTIGGLTIDARNVISGNTGDGLSIIGDKQTNGSQSNLIQGNFIGTDAFGTVALGNTGNGLFISGKGNGNTIGNTVGSTATGAGNIIAFNGLAGILIDSGLQNR